MHNSECNQEHLMVSEQAGDVIRKAHKMDWNGLERRAEKARRTFEKCLHV